MELREKLAIQSALLNLYNSLNDEKTRHLNTHNENFACKRYEQASNDWSYYEGYRDAVCAVLDYAVSTGYPKQLELHLHD